MSELLLYWLFNVWYFFRNVLLQIFQSKICLGIRSQVFYNLQSQSSSKQFETIPLNAMQAEKLANKKRVANFGISNTILVINCLMKSVSDLSNWLSNFWYTTISVIKCQVKSVSYNDILVIKYLLKSVWYNTLVIKCLLKKFLIYLFIG